MLGLLLSFLFIPLAGPWYSFGIVLLATLVGMLCAYLLYVVLRSVKKSNLGEDALQDALHQAVRHSDVTAILENILAGARASSLEARTVRHAVRRVRVFLKLFRFIGR